MRWIHLGWGIRQWRSFEELISEMDRPLEDFFERLCLPEVSRRGYGHQQCQFLTTRNNIPVKAALPGGQENVRVTVEGICSLLREREKDREKAKDEFYYACELCYGAF